MLELVFHLHSKQIICIGMIILIFACVVALILLIWFRTDAWLEYCRLLHLDRISFYKEFDVKHKEDASLTYFLYLRMHHDCFFVRLVTCPICLAVWLGLICGILGTLYFIPIYIIGGLLLFTIIDKLLG